MSLLDSLTLLSYIALNADILLQIKRIYKTKSSEDLSLLGMGVRYMAIMIILLKFMTLENTLLIVGQAFIALAFTAYFVLAIIYFGYAKQKR